MVIKKLNMVIKKPKRKLKDETNEIMLIFLMAQKLFLLLLPY
jgi:hypothetical protein